MIYTFEAGTEIVRLKTGHFDWEISTAKTEHKFLKLSKLLGDEKDKELQDALSSLLEKYLMVEFGKMGYRLTKKDDGA